MKRTGFTKRLVVCILASVVFMSSLSGCGKKKDTVAEAVNQAKEIDKEHIYREEMLDGIVKGKSYVSYLDYVGGKIRCAYADESGSFTFVTATVDGNVENSFTVPISEKNIFARFAMDDSENLYALYDVYPEAESEDSNEEQVMEVGDSIVGCFLVKFDKAGNEIAREDVFKDYSGGNPFESYSIVWTKDHGIVIYTARGIETYSEDGGLNAIIPHDDLNKFTWGTLTKGFGDQVYINGYTDSENMLMKVDLDDKKLGDPSKIYSQIDYGSFFGGEGYDLYVSGDEYIYGYDSKSDRVTELANIADSELGTGWGLDTCVAISETEIIASVSDDDSCYVSRLTKVKPEDVKEKTVVTLGGVNVNYGLIKEVYRFNKKSTDYRIKVIDYTETYENANFDDLIKQFNTDVISGNAPDMMSFNGMFNVNNYINKGILMDLTPLFDKGGVLENIEILPNIYDKMKLNDKIYTVFPSFTLNTVSVRNQFAEGKTSLTYDECDELIKNNGVGYNNAFGDYSSKNAILITGLQYSSNKYVDYANKKCDFKNDEFIGLLNFAKNFPDEYDYDDNKSVYNDFIEDKAIFLNSYINGFYDYKEISQAVFKDGCAFVGFPNCAGKNEAYIDPNMTVCVNNNSKHTDVAIEFIKSLFEDYNASDDFSSGFPADKATFEAAMKISTEPKYKMVNGQKEPEEEYTYIDDAKIKIEPLSEDEAKAIYDYILSVDTVQNSYDYTVENIVMEEAGAFFCGQKSAEDVADVIQSRVTTYINENS